MADFDSVFKAISHPTRRQILSLLDSRKKRLSSGEIQMRFPCSWPTLCQHLLKLERSGLVSKQSMGREVYYSIRTQRLIGIVKTWVQSFED